MVFTRKSQLMTTVFGVSIWGSPFESNFCDYDTFSQKKINKNSFKFDICSCFVVTILVCATDFCFIRFYSIRCNKVEKLFELRISHTRTHSVIQIYNNRKTNRMEKFDDVRKSNWSAMVAAPSLSVKLTKTVS